MPKIMQSSALRNRYNELSEFCNSNPEAVYITKNGDGDLAVMSIAFYEELAGRMELYNKIVLGFKAASEGRVRSVDDAMKDLGL